MEVKHTAPIILVIEDNPHIAHVLAELLRDHGLKAQTTSSAEEGLRLARTLGPQLIISDYNLPGEHGVDLLLELRDDERTRNIPFVLVTAHGNAGLRDEALAAGARAVLFKPFDAEQLFRTVDPILRGQSPSTIGPSGFHLFSSLSLNL